MAEQRNSNLSRLAYFLEINRGESFKPSKVTTLRMERAQTSEQKKALGELKKNFESATDIEQELFRMRSHAESNVSRAESLSLAFQAVLRDPSVPADVKKSYAAQLAELESLKKSRDALTERVRDGKERMSRAEMDYRRDSLPLFEVHVVQDQNNRIVGLYFGADADLKMWNQCEEFSFLSDDPKESKSATFDRKTYIKWASEAKSEKIKTQVKPTDPLPAASPKGNGRQ